MFGVRFVIGVRVTDEWWYDQSQALLYWTVPLYYLWHLASVSTEHRFAPPRYFYYSTRGRYSYSRRIYGRSERTRQHIYSTPRAKKRFKIPKGPFLVYQ